VESSLSNLFRLSKYENTIEFPFSGLVKLNSEGPFLGPASVILLKLVKKQRGTHLSRWGEI
jgi:hypothetical protein